MTRLMGIDEHILAGPRRVDNTLEMNVNKVMNPTQHASANTMDTGGIACEYLRSPMSSIERKRNTLELKTARDGPAPTKSSHVLEAVILKAANEMIKTLSRSSRTNTTSLNNRKGRLINFGTLAFAFIVRCVTGVYKRVRIKCWGRRGADAREGKGSLAGQRASTGGKRGREPVNRLF